MAPVSFPEPVSESGVMFYSDPALLTPDLIDPLLWPAVERINASGWVWTAEACQGHPEDDSSIGPWAGNHRAMVRLVCRAADLGRMLEACALSFRRFLDGDIEVGPLPWEPWVELRPSKAPRYAEAVIYVGQHGGAVGQRDAAIVGWERFASLVTPRHG